MPAQLGRRAGVPAARACAARVLLASAVALGASRAREAPLKLSELASGYVQEDDFEHYAVRIPPSSRAVKVIITPIFGDPDVYLSFVHAEPDDTTATWMMDGIGTEERLLRRQAADFCVGEPCTLHVSVYGYEASEFKLAVYNATDLSSGGDPPMCAPGCAEFALSDGICDGECNTTACFYDGGDCLVSHSRGTCDWRTRAGCPSSWIGDGVCDEECFVEECEWDGTDCAHSQTDEICHPGCMAGWVNDGECDEECNNEPCSYDGNDCAHAVSDCYHSADGADYRGQVSQTSSGLQCMRWSEQYPHQHAVTHGNFPRSGLGGHNFCRNPEGREAQPFCFTTHPTVRWEFCNVPKPFELCMANEMPHAASHGAAEPCTIDGPAPSGPLPRFRAACGPTGDNSTYGAICSRACCNAAEEAAMRCPADSTHRREYTTYTMDVQWSMLQHGCRSCRVYKHFFENAHMLRSPAGAQIQSLISNTGVRVLLVAGAILLLLLLAIICLLVRYVHARKNYALQTADVEAGSESDADFSASDEDDDGDGGDDGERAGRHTSRGRRE
ncbi:hypothetical protein KFE25_012090 [Diacronema lutheri]|uniref:Kringle domain-containing protein n=1 Tax=Diacronema lutheri TaxID=2081491 RepID=A0A8J5XG22_DIALT|nr:hypothetical protein KFE25_012090 [Diacronema lutheri]